MVDNYSNNLILSQESDIKESHSIRLKQVCRQYGEKSSNSELEPFHFNVFDYILSVWGQLNIYAWVTD